MGAEGGLQASASAGIQGALPGQGQWLVLKQAQGVLEEDTRRELGGGFLQRLGREPGPQLRAEGTRPDPGPSALGPKANPPPIGTTQFSRQRGVALGSPRSVCPAKMPPGLPRVAPQAPSPLSFPKVLCVPPAEAGACPGAPGSPVLQPSTSPKCCSQGSPGDTPPLGLSQTASQLCGQSFPEPAPTLQSCRPSPAPIHRPRGAGDGPPPASHSPHYLEPGSNGRCLLLPLLPH